MYLRDIGRARAFGTLTSEGGLPPRRGQRSRRGAAITHERAVGLTCNDVAFGAEDGDCRGRRVIEYGSGRYVEGLIVGDQPVPLWRVTHLLARELRDFAERTAITRSMARGTAIGHGAEAAGHHNLTCIG